MAVRILRARHRTTGQWFQALDAGATGAAAFASAVATTFGVDAADVDVVEGTVPDAGARDALAHALASGLCEGLSVIARGPTPWPPGDGDAAPVATAADVDAVTAKRIRRLYGSADDELAWSRRARRALATLLNDPALTGVEVSDVELSEARAITAQDRLLHDRIERLVAQGRLVKASRGW